MEGSNLEERTENIDIEKFLNRIENFHPFNPSDTGPYAGWICGLVESLPFKPKLFKEFLKYLKHDRITSLPDYDKGRYMGYFTGALAWYAGPATIIWTLLKLYA